MNQSDNEFSGATSESGIVFLTAEITSAYVSNNAVQAAELPKVMDAIYASLLSLRQPKPEPAAPRREPHISIRKSVTPDAIISMEDGKPYKSLKRHLSGRGMTPQEYREKWGLPHDYPMVASSYATMRSELAKSFGLGRKRAEPVQTEPAKRGRPKKEAA